jgi:hypothetical protein
MMTRLFDRCPDNPIISALDLPFQTAAVLHRPDAGGIEHIWSAYSPDLVHRGKPHYVLPDLAAAAWDSLKVATAKCDDVLALSTNQGSELIRCAAFHSRSATKRGRQT